MRMHAERCELRANSPHDLLIIGVTRRMDERRISVGNALRDRMRENTRRIGKTRETRQSLGDDPRKRTRLDEAARNIRVDLGDAPAFGRRMKVESRETHVAL